MIIHILVHTIFTVHINTYNLTLSDMITFMLYHAYQTIVAVSCVCVCVCVEQMQTQIGMNGHEQAI